MGLEWHAREGLLQSGCVTLPTPWLPPRASRRRSWPAAPPSRCASRLRMPHPCPARQVHSRASCTLAARNDAVTAYARRRLRLTCHAQACGCHAWHAWRCKRGGQGMECRAWAASPACGLCIPSCCCGTRHGLRARRSRAVLCGLLCGSAPCRAWGEVVLLPVRPCGCNQPPPWCPQALQEGGRAVFTACAGTHWCARPCLQAALPPSMSSTSPQMDIVANLVAAASPHELIRQLIKLSEVGSGGAAEPCPSRRGGWALALLVPGLDDVPSSVLACQLSGAVTSWGKAAGL